MRKGLAVLGVVSGLLAACDSSTLGTLTQSNSAIRVTGNAKVIINNTGTYTSQATFSDVNRLEISLTSGGLTTPVLKTLDRSQLTSANPSVTFEQIPVGTASFRVTAFDNTSASIGSATASTQILEAQTSNVAVTVKLAPTYVTDNAQGSATAQVSIVDGDVVKIAPQVGGTYDARIDNIVRSYPSVLAGTGLTSPDLIAVSFKPYGFDSSDNMITWNSGTVIVDYTLYEASVSGTKGAVITSGQTTFTSSSMQRTIEVAKTNTTGYRYGVMDCIARFPNGRTFYGTQLSVAILQRP